MLSDLYCHPRDKNIIFIEDREKDIHEYSIEGIEGKPISVTKLVHKYFPEFNAPRVISNMMGSKKWSTSPYFGMTAQAIEKKWKDDGKEASELGTAMHKNIELYFNKLLLENDSTKEFNMFLDFWAIFSRKYPNFKPYRTEWLIYDEDIKLAGSVDFVLTNNNNEIIILDWKRSKEIKANNVWEKGNYPFDQLHNCNYVHYTLQLNLYRHILENKYGKKVLGMAIVILHPNQNKYKCHRIHKVDLSNVWSSLTKRIE